MYSAAELFAKRTFDVVTAAAGLAAAAPLLGATALVVKATSPGPALFLQERIGKGGHPFRLLKFRTMRHAAPGLQVTSGTDSRITSVGRVLRKTKLDELPSLLNVVLGDLTLVGPRPEVARYVDLYPAEDREFIQQFRPGITDPATVVFRNEEAILSRSADPERTYVDEILPQKVRMYREFLEGASFIGDVRILIDTVRVIVQPSAARTA